MALRYPRRRRWSGAIWIGAILLLFALNVDDWRRDFTATHAEISFKMHDKSLRPLVSERTAADLAVALQWAARRAGGYELVDATIAGADTHLTFVHTGRFLPIREDVTMRIRDRGEDRVVTGESRSRWDHGDLGRNPHNLRRLLTELEDVLEGSE